MRTDRGKLTFLGRTAAGTGVIEKITDGRGEIAVPRLEESFSVTDLTQGLERDQGIVASFLYYLGLLTLAPRDGAAIRLRIPNLVVEKLFLDRLLRVYLPEPMLFDDTRYTIHSEPELDQKYADLCLLVRPEMRRRGFFDLLFEFKLVRQKDLGKKRQELKEMDEASLRSLPEVKKAFREAREQASYYRGALERRHGTELELRSYVVVAVGLVRMLGEELS